MADILNRIREGMSVYDSSGEAIGTVDLVKMSDDGAATPASETNPAQRPVLIDLIVEAFRNDGIPEVLQDRLMREGFVRMDTSGLLAADRYILPDQIASVSDDRVMLNVQREELVRRGTV